MQRVQQDNTHTTVILVARLVVLYLSGVIHRGVAALSPTC